MKKYFPVLLACGALALSGCATPHQTAKWEYQTVILKNRSEAVPLDDPDAGWVDEDKIINEMAKDGWIVEGYSVDLASGQWFLLKRRVK